MLSSLVLICQVTIPPRLVTCCRTPPIIPALFLVKLQSRMMSYPATLSANESTRKRKRAESKLGAQMT